MKISLAALAIVALLFFAANAAKADNIVSVALNPVDYGVQVLPTGQSLGDEIVAITFTWDTTTEVISNIVIAATGPFEGVPIQGKIDLNANKFGDGLWFGGSEIGTLNFQLSSSVNPAPITYVLDYNLHGLPGITMALPSTPGTYYADENLDCGFCFAGDENSSFATATVTAAAPVATPEPGTLALIGVGLAGLLARKRLRARRNQVPKAVWEPLA